jgi:hypothetical protein
MELAIDAGNTRIKVALFINNGIHKIWKVKKLEADLVEELASFPIQNAIISSTRKKESLHPAWFTLVEKTLWLDHKTALPFMKHLPDTRNTWKRPSCCGCWGTFFISERSGFGHRCRNMHYLRYAYSK